VNPDYRWSAAQLREHAFFAEQRAEVPAASSGVSLGLSRRVAAAKSVISFGGAPQQLRRRRSSDILGEDDGRRVFRSQKNLPLVGSFGDIPLEDGTVE
jgi:hypothetical protein